MKEKAYRLDKERIDGSYCGSIHFKTLEEAERHLGYCKILIDYEVNAISNNKRYGTIWETKLTI